MGVYNYFRYNAGILIVLSENILFRQYCILLFSLHVLFIKYIIIIRLSFCSYIW
jgi:hypothetical protein